MTSLRVGRQILIQVNVTSMRGYVSAYTGYTAMTNLDLGEKFDTSNVTNYVVLCSMKQEMTSMASLDLGEKFNTSQVTRYE